MKNKKIKSNITNVIITCTIVNRIKLIFLLVFSCVNELKIKFTQIIK